MKADAEKLKLFTGRANPQLAQKICDYLQIPLGRGRTELFPDGELRKLPPDHAVWYAQEKVDPRQLPKDSEFWLWGLDACCRTSVVYCPRSLSCYWELAHPYREVEYAKDVKEQIERFKIPAAKADAIPT